MMVLVLSFELLLMFFISSLSLLQPTSPQTIPASFTPSKLLTPSLFQKAPPSSGLLVPMAMTSMDSPTTSRISPVPTLTKEQFKEAYLFMLQV